MGKKKIHLLPTQAQGRSEIGPDTAPCAVPAFVVASWPGVPTVTVKRAAKVNKSRKKKACVPA